MRGEGGEGVPVDKLDQCCCMHDKCFGDIMKGVCDGKVSIRETNQLVYIKGSKAFRNSNLFRFIFRFRGAIRKMSK